MSDYQAVDYGQESSYQNADVVVNAGADEPGNVSNVDKDDNEKMYRFSMYHPQYYTAKDSGGDISWLLDAIRTVDAFSREWAAIFFALFRFILDPVLNIYLEAVSLALYVVQKAVINVFPVILDNMFKPLFHVYWHYIFLPFSTAAHQFFLILLNMDSLHRVLNAIVNAFCKIFGSLKIVQITNVDGGRAVDDDPPAAMEVKH